MKVKVTGLILLASIFIISCTGYRKVVRSSDMQLKYDKAIEYFKAEKYAKAYPLFEELYIAYRGTTKGERIAYYQAFCDFNLRDYYLAAHRFSQFYRNYPNSGLAEECQFMSAFCTYLVSPKYSLDQADSYKAIRSLQLFAIDNPNSERIDSCNVLLDELRMKIENKDYEKSRLYYRMENYRSAVVSFENFNRRYPNSIYREESMFMAFDSSYELAINSVEEKKETRLQDAIKAYITFADRFPESKRLKEAGSKHQRLLTELEKRSNT